MTYKDGKVLWFRFERRSFKDSWHIGPWEVKQQWLLNWLHARRDHFFNQADLQTGLRDLHLTTKC